MLRRLHRTTNAAAAAAVSKTTVVTALGISTGNGFSLRSLRRPSKNNTMLPCAMESGGVVPSTQARHKSSTATKEKKKAAKGASSEKAKSKKKKAAAPKKKPSSKSTKKSKDSKPQPTPKAPAPPAAAPAPPKHTPPPPQHTPTAAVDHTLESSGFNPSSLAANEKSALQAMMAATVGSRIPLQRRTFKPDGGSRKKVKKSNLEKKRERLLHKVMVDASAVKQSPFQAYLDAKEAGSPEGIDAMHMAANKQPINKEYIHGYSKEQLRWSAEVVNKAVDETAKRQEEMSQAERDMLRKARGDATDGSHKDHAERIVKNILEQKRAGAQAVPPEYRTVDVENDDDAGLGLSAATEEGVDMSDAAVNGVQDELVDDDLVTTHNEQTEGNDVMEHQQTQLSREELEGVELDPKGQSRMQSATHKIGSLKETRGDQLEDNDYAAHTKLSSAALDNEVEAGHDDASMRHARGSDGGTRPSEFTFHAVELTEGEEAVVDGLVGHVNKEQGVDAPATTKADAAISTVFGTDLDAIEGEYELAIAARREEVRKPPCGTKFVKSNNLTEAEKTATSIKNFRDTLQKERLRSLEHDAKANVMDAKKMNLFAPLQERIAVAADMREQRRTAEETRKAKGDTATIATRIDSFYDKTTPMAERLKESDFETEESYLAEKKRLIEAEIAEARNAGYDLDDPQWHVGHKDFINVPKQFYVSRFVNEQVSPSKQRQRDWVKKSLGREVEREDIIQRHLDEESGKSASTKIKKDLGYFSRKVEERRKWRKASKDALGASESSGIAAKHFGFDENVASEETITSNTASKVEKALDSIITNDATIGSSAGSAAASSDTVVFDAGADWRAKELQRLHRRQKQYVDITGTDRHDAQMDHIHKSWEDYEEMKNAARDHEKLLDMEFEDVAAGELHKKPFSKKAANRNALQVLGDDTDLTQAQAEKLDNYLMHPHLNARDRSMENLIEGVEMMDKRQYRPKYIPNEDWVNSVGAVKEVSTGRVFNKTPAENKEIEVMRSQLAAIDAQEDTMAMYKESPLDANRFSKTEKRLRHKMMSYLRRFPNNRRIQLDKIKILSISDAQGNQIPVPREEGEYLTHAEAQQLANDLGLDLIQIRTETSHEAVNKYQSLLKEEDVATCVIDDHQRHARMFLRLEGEIKAFRSETYHHVNIPLRGPTHHHAIGFKMKAAAKELYRGNPVTLTLTDFGTPREGANVFGDILAELRRQATQVKAWHTAGKMKFAANNISIQLLPTTRKNPKGTITHPSQADIIRGRDQRLVERERELYYDNIANLHQRREQGDYIDAIKKGVAWSEEGSGLSLQKLRKLKRMLGYLPKGNKELYKMRGDTPENFNFPYHTNHVTSIDAIINPRESNLDQAERGASVLAKRAKMSISEMADTNETEGNPSTLSRFFYRSSGDAWGVGELKENLGLTNKFGKKPPRLDNGFATLGVQEDDGMSNLHSDVVASQK